jgi:hypothetical protein
LKLKNISAGFIFLLLGYNVSAQTKTNLEIIYSLLEKSVIKADSILNSSKTIFLSISTPQVLEVLKPKVIESFNKKGFAIKSSKEEVSAAIDYTIVSAKVEYKHPFTDGFFGAQCCEREIKYDYSLTATIGDKRIIPFAFENTYLDTIAISQISTIELQSLPFTQAVVPSQPFLSNLWEPIVVIGTLIGTIILLFTVRSK